MIELDRDFTLDTLTRMVAIDSVNPGLVPGGAGEGAMAEYLADLCRSMGLDVTLHDTAPGRPNVIARWAGQGGGKSLLLTGHTDVVGVTNMEIPPFTPLVKGDKLYGRGSMDMKGGLASILGAVHALQARQFEPDGDIILGFVTDEEYASIGTAALVEQVQADAALLTEPTAMEVVIAHRGFAWVEITAHGYAAHGSLYDVGIDAIAHMGRVLAEVERLDRDVLPRRGHPLLGRASCHASGISGGLGASTYPDRCTLEIEHRLLPDEDAGTVEHLWAEVLDRLHRDDPAFHAEFEMGFSRPGYEIGVDAPIVSALCSAYSDVLGSPAPMSGMRAWLDSALLAEAGIPTAILGPGGDGMHGAVEYVSIPDVLACGAVIAQTTQDWVTREQPAG